MVRSMPWGAFSSVVGIASQHIARHHICGLALTRSWPRKAGPTRDKTVRMLKAQGAYFR